MDALRFTVSKIWPVWLGISKLRNWWSKCPYVVFQALSCLWIDWEQLERNKNNFVLERRSRNGKLKSKQVIVELMIAQIWKTSSSH